jgi:hypothetical protein
MAHSTAINSRKEVDPGGMHRLVVAARARQPARTADHKGDMSRAASPTRDLLVRALLALGASVRTTAEALTTSRADK